MTRTILGAVVAALVLGATAGSASASPTPGEPFTKMEPPEYIEFIRDAHEALDGERTETAYRDYLKAACAGDKDSQFALGTMYLLGEGTTADGLMAYAWYAVAAEINDKRFRDAFAKVSAAVPAEHRALAESEGARLIEAYGLKATGQSCKLEAEVGTRIERRICRPEISGGQTARLYSVRTCDAPEAARVAAAKARLADQ